MQIGPSYRNIGDQQDKKHSKQKKHLPAGDAINSMMTFVIFYKIEVSYSRENVQIQKRVQKCAKS